MSATAEHGIGSGTEHVEDRRRVLSGLLSLTHTFDEVIDLATGTDIHGTSEITVLTSLRLNGPQRPRTLAELNGFTRGGTTNLIDRLESRGLVTRANVPTDRRGVEIRLTDDGAALIERITAAIRRVINLASPLIEGWKPYFLAQGWDVGRLRLPRTDRQTLVYTLDVGNAGSTIQPVCESAFGRDDATPHLTLHVLLLATDPGGTRPTWISDATYLSSASVSDLLDRLEERDLVTRISGAEADGRVTTVSATDRGRDALDFVIEHSEPVIRAVAAALFSPDAPPVRGGEA